LSEATEWLGKGPIWRHRETGEIAGPVIPYQDSKGRERLGPIDRSLQIIIAGAFVVLLIACARTFYQMGEANHSSSAGIQAFAGTLIVGIACALPFFAVHQGFVATNTRNRAVLAAIVVLFLYYQHVGLVVLGLAVIFSGFAIAGRSARPKAVNDRMRARGYVPVQAVEKERPAPPQPEPRTPRSLEEVTPNELLPEELRQGDPPPGYSGRWGKTEYRDGVQQGFYARNLGPPPDWPKDDHGRPIGMNLTFFGEKFIRVEPPRTPQAPYGHVWTDGYGWTPRQQDPMESPVPKGWTDRPKSKVHGDNEALSAEDLIRAGMGHPRKKNRSKK
jgi:hypothetical protein